MEDRSPNNVTIQRVVARIAAVASAMVVASLVVNEIVTNTLGPGADRHSVWLAGSDVGLEYVRNTGAAFGMFQGYPELLAAISIVVSIGLVILILSEMRSAFWATMSAGLTVGGAMANLVGRIVDGYVTDYFAVGPWPRFNVADSAITVGIAIFVVSLVFERASYGTEVDGDRQGAPSEAYEGEDRCGRQS